MSSHSVTQQSGSVNLHPDDPFYALETTPRESAGARQLREEWEVWERNHHNQPPAVRVVIGALSEAQADLRDDHSALADQMRALLAETIERIEQQYPDRSKALRATLAVGVRQCARCEL